MAIFQQQQQPAPLTELEPLKLRIISNASNTLFKIQKFVQPPANAFGKKPEGYWETLQEEMPHADLPPEDVRFSDRSSATAYVDALANARAERVWSTVEEFSI